MLLCSCPPKQEDLIIIVHDRQFPPLLPTNKDQYKYTPSSAHTNAKGTHLSSIISIHITTIHLYSPPIISLLLHSTTSLSSTQIKKNHTTFSIFQTLPIKKHITNTMWSYVPFLAPLFFLSLVHADDPYRFFTWNITFGDIYPLGVPQQVGDPLLFLFLCFCQCYCYCK